MPLPPRDSPSTWKGCRLVDGMKLHGRGKGFSLKQLPKKKVAATLDTPPPMLYNGIATGSIPAVEYTLTEKLPSSVTYPGAFFI